MSVDHSTTMPLRDIAQKKGNDNLGYIEQGTSSKDERAKAAFLWDIACSTHHPLFQKYELKLKHMQNDLRGWWQGWRERLVLLEGNKRTWVF